MTQKWAGIIDRRNIKITTMLNDRLLSLYTSSLPGLSALYSDLDRKEIFDYVGPFLLYCWEEEYLSARHRLMIIGQETYGWDADYVRSVDDVKRFMQSYKDFELGKNYNSLFWRYAHLINEMINGEDGKNFVWNNVNKFGIDGAGRPDQAVLDNENLHFNLLAREIGILKPDVCIFLSGPTYDADLKEKLGDLRLEPFQDYPLNEAARLRSRFLPDHSFRTYHPGYGNHYSEWYIDLLRKISNECI